MFLFAILQRLVLLVLSTWYNFLSTIKLCHSRRSQILATVLTIKKNIQNGPCYTSFLVFWRFLIGKIETTHFSNFSHSIELFKSYKNISFLKIKNIDDLIITKTTYRRTMIFLLYSLNDISLKNNFWSLYLIMESTSETDELGKHRSL